jgi:hypothetical protein
MVGYTSKTPLCIEDVWIDQIMLIYGIYYLVTPIYTKNFQICKCIVKIYTTYKRANLNFPMPTKILYTDQPAPSDHLHPTKSNRPYQSVGLANSSTDQINPVNRRPMFC